MPRQIIPIGEENQSGESKTQKKRQDTCSQILTSAEMQEQLEAWDKSNHGDLIVDEELLSKLRRYNEFEQELISLRKERARRIWEPYRVNEEVVKTEQYRIYILTDQHNIWGTNIGSFTLGKTKNGEFSLVDLKTFKYFMLYFKEPDASWIETEEAWADLSAYIAQKGGIFDRGVAVIHIDICTRR